jgi:hypothetical protein
MILCCRASLKLGNMSDYSARSISAAQIQVCLMRLRCHDQPEHII